MSSLVFICAAGGAALLIAPLLRRESSVVRFAIIAFSLAMCGRYLYWRLSSTLPRWDFSLLACISYGFLAMELVATYLGIKNLLLVKRTRNRSQEANEQLDWYGSAPPRVDVLIATYNESWLVLEKTLVGATHQNYPNYGVWVLDDGNRPWLQQRCAEYGVGYVSRSDNAHYKAGNLNHGLKELRARGIALEFLALLDADFIARPEFVRRTLALMKSQGIGIVQTPQCFYNPDPHQRIFGSVQGWPDEQRSWFDVYLPSLDAQGWATCCGTSCLIRVAALNLIGGFPTDSVCEDTLTSMKMWQHGFQTAYLHERLTVGLAPEGIGEYLTQRARWLLGGVQNTQVSGARPGVRGRVLYWLDLWKMVIFGLMRPAWMSICIAYWFTGVFLIRSTDLNEAISYFGPLWLDRFFQGWLFAGTRLPFVSDAVWLLLSPLWITETFRAIVGSKARFKVTDKAVLRDKSVIHWNLLSYHLVFVALLLGGLLYTLVSPEAPGHHAGFFQSNTLLTFFFVLVICAGVGPTIEPPKRRVEERYETAERIHALVNGQACSWQCVDLSLSGVLLNAGAGAIMPATLDLQLEDLQQPIKGRLVRTTPQGRAAYVFEGGSVRGDLIRRLYCTDRYIPNPSRWGLMRALAAFWKRVLL